MTLYPLKLTPVYTENVWGGQALKEIFNKDVPFKHTGESWNVASHNRGASIIENGSLKGKSLSFVFNNFKEELLGSAWKHLLRFPLLIKLIDAKKQLSLQVHPQDNYAREHEGGELGKSEMWYVLRAKEGAKLALGLKKGVSKEQFKLGVERGDFDSLVNEIPVKKGDVVYVPAGLLHSIGEGIVLFEVQQNSDTVYRVFDWNRPGLDGCPRELHLKQALDVLDFKGRLKNQVIKGLELKRDGNSITYYVANRHFATEKITLVSPMKENTNGKMILYTIISGTASIHWNNSEIKMGNGETVLVPACTGEFHISGQGEILKNYIPDIESDFLQPLKSAGYSEEEIYRSTAVGDE